MLDPCIDRHQGVDRLNKGNIDLIDWIDYLGLQGASEREKKKEELFMFIFIKIVNLILFSCFRFLYFQIS